MKPAKHLPYTSNKLTNVPELNDKKRQLRSPISPKPKEKNSAKSVRDKIEPMVLRSPPIGESIVRYALPIPSRKAKELISEDEVIKKIIKHLKMAVSALEETFEFDIISGKKLVEKPENAETSLFVGDDMNSFLICCSQLATQLEEAVKEERNILESLFQWFQVQVNQMEEISKDQSVLEAECPVPEKTTILSFSEVIKQVQRLAQLKERLKHISKYSFKAMLSKPMVSQNPPEPVKNYENVEKIIEEFIKTHSAEKTVDISAPEPQTACSVTNQLKAMLKIFEKQSNMLERAMKDHDLLEAKYNKKESDLQLLLEEKSMLENELQNLKNAEKIKTTPDQTQKINKKMEKKKGKGKSEDLEEKKSTGKQLKIKEDLLQLQKVAFALEIENKLLQEQLKQALQISPIQHGSLSGESSEKKRSSPAISDLSQILGSQDESAFSESSNEVSPGENLSGASSSEILDKSFTTVSSSEEIQESLSLGTLSQENETVTASLTSLPDITRRKMTDSDTSKVIVSEEKLPSKTEKQTYQEAKKLQGQEIDDVTDENLLSLDKLLISNDRLQIRNSFSKSDHLTQEMDDRTDEKLLKGDQNLDQKVLDDFRFKTTRRGALRIIINTSDEVISGNLMFKDQDSVSGTQKQLKKQRTTTGKRLKTHDEEADENLMLENQDSVSKIQMQTKKTKTSRAERLKTHNEEPDENLMLKSQDSVSKIQMRIKKQKTSRGERLKNHNVETDENLMLEHQDSVSKTQMQLKKQRTTKEEKHNIHDEEPDENLILEHHNSDTKTQMKVKKERTLTEERLNNLFFYLVDFNESLYVAFDELSGNDLMIEEQDSVSKTQMKEKKQRPSRGKSFSTVDEGPGENLTVEYEDSVSNIQMQEKKERTANGERVKTQDEERDENLLLKNQDSVTKIQMQIKNQKTSRRERLKTWDDEPDENLMLKNQDSMSKIQMQIKKQKTSREESLKSHGEKPNENLMLEHQDSVSKPQVKLKKQRTSREENLNTQTMTLHDENTLSKENVSISKSQTQAKNHGAPKREKLSTWKMNEESDENLLPEDGKHKNARTEIFKNQAMDELSDEDPTEKDLELAAEYMDQIRARGLDQSQISKIRNEAASELADTTENLPAFHPSINDLIFQLDLNKVVENDIEYLKGAIQRDVMKEEIKTQSMDHFGVNLLKSKDVSTHHQEDVLMRNISPSKFQTKVINLSLFENKEKTSESFSSFVTQSLNPVNKTARGENGISKTTHFTSLNKIPSGQPKNVKLNKEVVELKNNLPTMISTPRKRFHKVE
ncbi:uncharacterized protein CCDC7 isoform X2 [Tamandua tetradactyla]|uniref:uncharacterized protein CCDC7 isoform X2 n=1 Tax=Tamandua tetradactyla TaxID=48850 RepID=UPI004054867D